MKIAIDLIKVEDKTRIRKEIGNLLPLIESISKVGLINPILIDEQSNLVAGFRRLEACRKLGMEEVDVRIVELGGDLMKMLEVEVAENFFRKDFTSEEVLATERRRQEIFEATRKKGLPERFRSWLKNIFVPSSAPAKKSATAAQSSSEETTTSAQDFVKKETVSSSGAPQETTQHHSVNKRDDHDIKWRTS